MKLSFSSNTDLEEYTLPKDFFGEKKVPHRISGGQRWQDSLAGTISEDHIFKSDYIKSLILVTLVDFQVKFYMKLALSTTKSIAWLIDALNWKTRPLNLTFF